METEKQLAALSESQLGLMSQIFPRHVIELLASAGNEEAFAAHINSLARSHDQVTVLFMDIVGEYHCSCGGCWLWAVYCMHMRHVQCVDVEVCGEGWVL